MFGFLKKKLEEAKKGLERLVSKEEEAAEVKESVDQFVPIPSPPKPAKEKRPSPKKEPKARAEPEKRLDKPAIRTDEPEKREDEGRLETVMEEKTEEEKEAGKQEERKSIIGGFLKRITVKPVSEDDIDEFFSEMEIDLLQGNVAVEVVEALKAGLKKRLAGREIRRNEVGGLIESAFYESLHDIVNQGSVDIDEIIRKARGDGKAALFVFLGFNGAGKTTSVAKVARYLSAKGYKVIFAAGDTFRAASIEQLEVHAKKLGIGLVKQKYGSDSAAVIYDAMEHAKAAGIDVVLADTAGRMHTNANLMRELEKVIKVNKPDLRILVLDSLAGNDIVPQSQSFSQAAGIDCLLLTKTDANEKGGAILSATYCTSKPILFLGTGQDYDDLQLFEPDKFVKELLG